VRPAAGSLDCFGLAAIFGLVLVLAAFARGQQAVAAPATDNPRPSNAASIRAGGVTPQPSGRQPVASEIAETTMISYGNYRVFGAADRCNVYASGVEFDRHSWGYHFKARWDYVTEVLPFVLLSQPVQADFWGNPQSPDQELVHGFGASPFGFRLLWRDTQRVKPYLTGKIGMVVFGKPAFSPDSSNWAFNFQGEFGLEVRLNDRVELRLSPLDYFHVSNGYLAPSNPGMDELAPKFGLSYRLRKSVH
jgi:hypothetical protein